MKQTALITGSTGGIGYAFYEKLARQGYNLVLVGRNEAKLKEQKEMCRGGVAVEIICQDLRERNSAEIIYDYIQEKQLCVDVLINNAGFNETGYFHSTDMDKEVAMVDVHIITLTKLTKLLLPQMLKNGFGAIVNLGSHGSYIPSPLDAVYCATKAYVLSFSKALQGELKGTGVTVTTLCPGSTKTEFSKKAGIENTLLFKYFVMSPDKVADYAYKKMLKGKTVAIPGIYNKLLVFSSKILPASLINYLAVIMLSK